MKPRTACNSQGEATANAKYSCKACLVAGKPFCLPAEFWFCNGLWSPDENIAKYLQKLVFQQHPYICAGVSQLRAQSQASSSAQRCAAQCGFSTYVCAYIYICIYIYICALGSSRGSLCRSLDSWLFAGRMAAGMGHRSQSCPGATPSSSESIRGKTVVQKKNKNDANCYSEAALHLKAGFNALHVHANLGEWCRYSVAEHS